MKKIKLEVVMEDKYAREALTFFQSLIIHNIAIYTLSMEEYDG